VNFKEIEGFLERNRQFTGVSDLNLYDGKSGYYMMVLDEYSQVYIGTTNDIKRRIRQHWSNSKPFDDQHPHTRDFSRELGCFFVETKVFS
jgi:hypothetical protein